MTEAIGAGFKAVGEEDLGGMAADPLGPCSVTLKKQATKHGSAAG